MDYAKAIQINYSFDLVVSKTPGNISNSTNEIYDILLIKYFDYSFFVNLLKKYIYHYQDKWEMIDSHYDYIKKYIFNRLIESIENSATSNK
jgi:hypothetical protein